MRVWFIMVFVWFIEQHVWEVMTLFLVVVLFCGGHSLCYSLVCLKDGNDEIFRGLTMNFSLVEVSKVGYI